MEKNVKTKNIVSPFFNRKHTISVGLWFFFSLKIKINKRVEKFGPEQNETFRHETVHLRVKVYTFIVNIYWNLKLQTITCDSYGLMMCTKYENKCFKIITSVLDTLFFISLPSLDDIQNWYLINVLDRNYSLLYKCI